MNLSPGDCNLLNQIQKAFPVCERPFKVLGEALGISEEAALQKMKMFKEAKIIRQTSAIFESSALGYSSSLVALKIKPRWIEEAVKIINEHPGVSHHYQRSHEFNLWFTIAVSPDSLLGLERTVEIISKLTKADSFHVFPALKVYKIGVFLNLAGEKNAKKDKTVFPESKVHVFGKVQLTGSEIKMIRELQEDLEMVEEPFLLKAERLKVSQNDLFKKALDFMEKGIMRRFCAVLYHQKAGFTANAMVVWKASEDEVDEIGKMISRFNSVSHCYRRSVFSDWPYSIFSMIHGRSKEECDRIIAEILKDTGIRQYEILYTTAEYKKTRIKYFSPEFNLWEKKYG